MALAHVSSNNNAATAASVAKTFTPAGNNLLIVGCSSQLQGSAVGTGAALQITDNNGNVWLSATPQMYGLPTSGWDRAARIFYCISCNTGSTTITIACANGGAGVMTIQIDEFSGASSSPFDQWTWTSGISATPNSGNVVTTTANQIVYGMLIGVVNTITKGASFTQNGTLAETCAEWKIVSSAGTYSADGTMTSAHWLAGVATFSDQALAQPIRYQNGGGTNVNVAASTTLALTYMPIVGNLLVIAAWCTTTTGTITISDTAGNTIVALDGPVNQGAGAHIRTFYVQDALATPTTFTITFSSANIASLTVDEFSGVTDLDLHSLTGVTSGAGGVYTSPAFKTNQLVEAVWAYGMSQGSGSVVAPLVVGAQDSDGSLTGYFISNFIVSRTVSFIDSSGTGQADVIGVVTMLSEVATQNQWQLKVQ